jgi:hypothetical protein
MGKNTLMYRLGSLIMVGAGFESSTSGIYDLKTGF